MARIPVNTKCRGQNSTARSQNTNALFLDLQGPLGKMAKNVATDVTWRTKQMRVWTIALLLAAPMVLFGCEQTDLGRYCVVGQAIPPIDLNNEYGQPSVTVLNIEAPECSGRICLQQGPKALYPSQSDNGCNETNCPAPYFCDPDSGKCIYKVKAFCTTECKKHSDCKAGGEDSNGAVCSQFVCHKQERGETFEGHCICMCKDFLIKPNTDPPSFYGPDDVVPSPTGCQ